VEVEGEGKMSERRSAEGNARIKSKNDLREMGVRVLRGALRKNEGV
jgi:hypothetical protein